MGDHCEYEIVTVRRQAGRLEQIDQLGKSRQRFSAFLRLHEAIGGSLGVSFPLPKQLFLFNNERWLPVNQTRCHRYQLLATVLLLLLLTLHTLLGGCATSAPPSLASTSTPRSASRCVEPLNNSRLDSATARYPGLVTLASWSGLSRPGTGPLSALRTSR